MTGRPSRRKSRIFTVRPVSSRNGRSTGSWAFRCGSMSTFFRIAGASFDGSALDKSTEALAIEMAKQGHPFAHATPRLTRDAVAQRVDVAFVIDEGQRSYVERIEIHGNNKTRDYVIRREFDFGEGLE